MKTRCSLSLSKIQVIIRSCNSNRSHRRPLQTSTCSLILSCSSPNNMLAVRWGRLRCSRVNSNISLNSKHNNHSSSPSNSNQRFTGMETNRFRSKPKTLSSTRATSRMLNKVMVTKRHSKLNRNHSFSNFNSKRTLSCRSKLEGRIKIPFWTYLINHN